MAMSRLKNDTVYRWRILLPGAVADITAPAVAELNVNSDNSDPNALVFNPSCAINQSGSQFDLDDSEKDESLTFCQISGTQAPLSDSATVKIQYETAKDRWLDASSTLSADGYNTATLVHSLLAYEDNPMYILLSVGSDVDEPFVAGDYVSIVQVKTDYAVPTIATGANILWDQNFLFQTDIAWNVQVVA